MLATRNLGLIQYGESFNEVAQNMNLEAQAWERIMLLMEAKNRRLRVSDKEVIEQIEKYPFFQKNGVFDNSAYNYMLQAYFNTPSRVFEEQVRQNLVISKLFKSVTDFITDITDKETLEEYKKAYEEFSLNYISGSPADFSKDVSVDDNLLKGYFQANSVNFKQPLSFNVEYVSIEAAQTENKATQEAVKKLFNRLNKKGSDFTAVAKELGLNAKETGIFAESDPVPGIGWSPQVTYLLARSTPGKLVGPLQMDKFLYIMRVKERKEPFIPEFETVKDKVRDAYIKEKSRELANAKITACANDLKQRFQSDPKSVNLETAARMHGLKHGTTELFKYGSYIEGIGSSDAFWINAQKLQENQPSDILETPEAYYIIAVKTSQPIDQKKFEEGKATFKSLVLARKKEDFFSRFTQELRSRAQRS